MSVVRTALRDAHLVRFDSARARGWQVRLPLWHPLSGQREYTEFFADTRYGNSAAAKEAARRRRDGLFAREGLPLRLGGATTNKLNTTGLVGVGLGFDASSKGAAAFFWIAHWSDPDGAKRRKRFNVGVHGFETALRLAVELRERETGLVFSEEQLLYALSLREEVDYYVATGRRRRRKARRPARTRPLSPRQSQHSGAHERLRMAAARG